MRSAHVFTSRDVWASRLGGWHRKLGARTGASREPSAAGPPPRPGTEAGPSTCCFGA